MLVVRTPSVETSILQRLSANRADQFVDVGEANFFHIIRSNVRPLVTGAHSNGLADIMRLYHASMAPNGITGMSKIGLARRTTFLIIIVSNLQRIKT